MKDNEKKYTSNGIPHAESTFKRSSKAITVITLAVVVAVIVLNLIISAIGDVNLWYVDMSSPKYKDEVSSLYTVSDVLKSLLDSQVIPKINEINGDREKTGEDPIKLEIVFCADRDDIESDGLMRYISYTARGIKKLYPDLVEVKYVNITRDPSAVQKYKTTSAASIYSSDVILEFGTEYIIRNVSSFFYTDSTADEPWAYNGEQRLASMMLSVTRAESPICAITNNHGESLFDSHGKVKQEYSEFIKLIDAAGYDIEFLDLEKQDIPENCRMMITFDPSEDFKAYGDLGENNVSEIEKLDKYIDASNAFFYICGRNTPVLKNLEEYLTEWGITVARASDEDDEYENYALRDLVNCTDSGDVIVGNYAVEGIGATLTKDMRNQAYPAKVIFEDSTAIVPAQNYVKIYVDESAESGNSAYAYYSYYRNGIMRSMLDVFTSYPTAFAEIDGHTYEVATQQSSFKLMTITQESREVQESNYNVVSQSSYVLALASTDFLKNDVLSASAYGNADVLLSALRNVSGEAVPANVSLKTLYEYEIENTAAHETVDVKAWSSWLTIAPLAISLAVGVVVTVRRKYR